MAISAANVAKLNKMCTAAKEAALGTFIDSLPVAGVHTVTSGEASAGSALIATGLTSVTGYNANIFRSGSALNNFYLSSSSATANLTLKSTSGSYTMTNGDVVAWLAFK